MKKEISELEFKLIGIFGKLILDFIFSFSRITETGFEHIESIMNSRKLVAGVWHSRILAFIYLYKGLNGAALVSQAQDGEIIARILQKQGFDPVRGSTTRGGTKALALLVRKIKSGQAAVITPDGPQGPRYKVQPGIISLAQKAGVPILPMAYSAKHCIIFSSWDRFILPYPFSPCYIVYGRPVYVPRDAGRQAWEQSRLDLEKELCRITQQADQYFGRHTP
ncbi:DUF374 [Desulfonema limicola]|uniref:DUF374 n=1 Tax=Desulfonema limicola TaxID=45656 RepID=A0A975BAV2_9BACT|nr:lysophospholipid acyltransferase family protein [Desulfonema limicola]QTA81936.1 DUF374 [Desulfonema limicola]